MSQPEGWMHSSSENEEEGVDERATPISAKAPEADAQYRQPIVTSSNPAIQCLEQLFSDGKISAAKMAHYKASFNLLQETLKRSQDSELKLMQEAKAYRSKLEQQNQELETAELFPEGHNTEVSSLKQELLQAYNELKAAEERDYQMQFQIQCLNEEKLCLEKEYQNQPKPAELERRYMSLKESSEEMRKETIQLRHEVQTLTESVETQQKHTDKERCELDKLKELVENKEAELAQLLPIPIQLAKEIDSLTHRKSELEKQVAVMEEQRIERIKHKQLMEAKYEKLNKAKGEVLTELHDYRAQLMAAQKKQDRLLIELQMTKEKEANFMEQRGLLDIEMEQTVTQDVFLRDKLARDTQVKDRLLRTLKRNELQLKEARDDLILTQKQLERTQAQRDAAPEGDCLLQKRKDLENEVENLKRSLIIKQSMAGLEVHQAEEYMEQEQALIRESCRHREELHHLHRLILIKGDEREKKSQELLKAQLKYKLSKQDLQGKDLVIQEHKKQWQDAQIRLNVLAKLYEVTKGEWNKYMSLIQISNHNLGEVKEKLNKLEENVQIMQTIAINKDKMLQRSRLQHSQSYRLRDHSKNEISKISKDLQEMHDQREEQKLNISKLTDTINTQEQNLLHLRKSFESAVQERNERGKELEKRDQELCVMYERINKKEGEIQDNNMKIQDMDDEIRNLKILKKEQDRQINLLRQQVPWTRALQDEKLLLQIQLSETEDKRKELEKIVMDRSRAKELSGKDPSPEELVKKIEQLEVQLTKKEAQLLEMELVDKQVKHLSQRIRNKVENGKEDSLHLAKKTNELQAKIRECTRKIKAAVGELSMRQAESLTLQQEIKDKELQLDSCQRRLEQGLFPSDDTEQEWLRYLRDQHRCQVDAEKKARLAEEDEWKQLPNGVYTTAELRPNAYVPADDPLPVPKHYGALAPFKPTEPGANIRHIRKPKPKPIEI